MVQHVLEANQQRTTESFLACCLDHFPNYDFSAASQQRKDHHVAVVVDIEIARAPAVDEVGRLRVLDGPVLFIELDEIALFRTNTRSCERCHLFPPMPRRATPRHFDNNRKRTTRIKSRSDFPIGEKKKRGPGLSHS